MTTISPVRWSNLVNMGLSPYEYDYHIRNPKTETPAMRIGGYTHQLVLGKNSHEYTIFDDGRRQGAIWEAFKAEHVGKSILTRKEADTSAACAETLLDPRFSECLEHLTYGTTEQTLSWSVGVRACVGTPDVHSDRSVVDLKITADVNPRALQYHARRRAWHAQLAWYANGLEQIHPAPDRKLILVCVKSKPPHTATPVVLDKSTIAIGNKVWRAWFEELLICEAANHWPPYSETLVPWSIADEGEHELIFHDDDEIL